MKTLLTIIVLFIVSIGIGIVFAEIIDKDFTCEETEPQYVDTEDIMEDAIISNDPNIELTFDGDGSWTWWGESAPDMELQFVDPNDFTSLAIDWEIKPQNYIFTATDRKDFAEYINTIGVRIGDKTLTFTADEFLDKLGFGEPEPIIVWTGDKLVLTDGHHWAPGVSQDDFKELSETAVEGQVRDKGPEIYTGTEWVEF